MHHIQQENARNPLKMREICKCVVRIKMVFSDLSLEYHYNFIIHRPDYVNELEEEKTKHFNKTLALHR